MSLTAKDKLIHEIGEKMLSDTAYTENPWSAISLVMTVGHGQETMSGYRYMEGDTFEASAPNGSMGDYFDKFIELQDVMSEETGTKWLKCLVQISRPGPKINIQFEYDNPDRWKPEIKGLDMSEYAMSIRPEMP